MAAYYVFPVIFCMHQELKLWINEKLTFTAAIHNRNLNQTVGFKAGSNEEEVCKETSKVQLAWWQTRHHFIQTTTSTGQKVFSWPPIRFCIAFCLFVCFHQLSVTMNNNKVKGSNRNKTMKKQKLKEKITPIDDDGANVHGSLANSVLAPWESTVKVMSHWLCKPYIVSFQIHHKVIYFYQLLLLFLVIT